MPEDLATLSIKVDSSSAKPAVENLDKVVESGARAETATDRLARAVEKLSEKLDRLSPAEKKAKDDIDGAKKAAEDSLGPFQRYADELKQMAVAAVGLYALKSAFQDTTEEALHFSTAMAEISTLLSPEQSKQVGLLSSQIRELGNQFGQLPSEQAKALYEIISAGASDAAQAMEILTAADKLAIGGVTDVQTAADGLTTVLAAYAGQVRDATEASDSMFVAAAAGKTTIEELSRFIGKVAPIAAQTGVSLDELNAAAGVLTKNGQSTMVAMQGLRGVLMSVMNPSHEASVLAGALGVNYSVAALKAKGLMGFLDDLGKATKGNTEELAKLLGTTEAILPAMTLLSESGRAGMTQTMADMADKAGRTEAAFAKMAETPQFKIDQLRAKLSNLKIDLGNGLLDVLAPAAEKLARNFDGVTAAVGFLGRAVAVVGAMRFAAWIQDTVVALYRKVAATIAATTATNGLKAALSAMGGPIGVVAGLVTVAVMAFSAYSAAAEESRQKTMQWAQQVGGAADRSEALAKDVKDSLAVLNDSKKSHQEHARATTALEAAKTKLMALGPEFRAALAEEKSSWEGIAAAVEKVNRANLGKLNAEIASTQKQLKDVKPSAAAEFFGHDVYGPKGELLPGKEKQESVAKQRAPLEEKLNVLLEERARIEEALAPREEQVAKATKKTAAATTESANAVMEQAKAHAAAEKAAAKWLERLEEKARQAGKDKDDAILEADEYKMLTGVMKARAEAAADAIEKAEEQKKADKAAAAAAREHAEKVKELKDELLGANDLVKWTEAQKLLNDELAEGNVTLEKYNDLLEKARQHYTEQGKKDKKEAEELERLRKQVSDSTEDEQKLARLNKLYGTGKLALADYAKEAAKLQRTLNEGFGLAATAIEQTLGHVEEEFLHFTETGEFRFDKMVQAIIQDLIKLLTHKAMTKFVEMAIDFGAGLLGGSGGGGGAPALAAGGPAHRGKTYLVGERGPELFVPSENGAVVPPGGGGTVVSAPVTVHVYGDGSSSVDAGASGGKSAAFARRLGEVVRRVIRDEQAPGGMLYGR